MKPENTLPKFPLNLEEIAAAIAAAPEQADDAECPYDPNDPASVEAFWDGAAMRIGGLGTARLRGPQKTPVKVSTTVRFDADVLEAFRATGPGWQTRMNDALREWLEAHGEAA